MTQTSSSNGAASMKQIKALIITAMCIALGVALPVAFHSIPNSGSVLLPMHIPVLLCGLVCGWPFGLACGVATPLLSNFVTGMPPAAYLPAMICELAVYGLSSGLIYRLTRTKNTAADIYIALTGAMLAGRLVYGAVNALIFRAGSYSMQIWLSSVFITALPGIIIQFFVIPALIFALQRAKIIPQRY